MINAILQIKVCKSVLLAIGDKRIIGIFLDSEWSAFGMLYL